MKHCISFLSLFFGLMMLSNCNARNGKDIEALDRSVRTNSETDLFAFHQKPIVNYADSLNYTDKNGWKQGKHIEKNQRGKIIHEATYVNDTIVGRFRFWDRMQHDGFYRNGKKEGNWNMYYSNGTVLLITHYEEDSIIWHAPYIANQRLLVPMKDFTFVAESFDLEIPHPNGKTWYEGRVENKIPVGVHSVYYENGKRRGVINYDSLYSLEYNEQNEIIRKDSLLNHWWR